MRSSFSRSVSAAASMQEREALVSDTRLPKISRAKQAAAQIAISCAPPLRLVGSAIATAGVAGASLTLALPQQFRGGVTVEGNPAADGKLRFDNPKRHIEIPFNITRKLDMTYGLGAGRLIDFATWKALAASLGFAGVGLLIRELGALCARYGASQRDYQILRNVLSEYIENDCDATTLEKTSLLRSRALRMAGTATAYAGMGAAVMGSVCAAIGTVLTQPGALLSHSIHIDGTLPVQGFLATVNLPYVGTGDISLDGEVRGPVDLRGEVAATADTSVLSAASARWWGAGLALSSALLCATSAQFHERARGHAFRNRIIDALQSLGPSTHSREAAEATARALELDPRALELFVGALAPQDEPGV